MIQPPDSYERAYQAWADLIDIYVSKGASVPEAISLVKKTNTYKQSSEFGKKICEAAFDAARDPKKWLQVL